MKREIWKRCSLAVAVLCTLATWTAAAVSADEQECRAHKNHQVTERHGPWMISVAKLPADNEAQQKQAEETAQAIVAELRKQKIPAYRSTQSVQISGESSHSRTFVTVYAGHYRSADDALAQQTLNYVRNFQPSENIANLQEDPQGSTPFSKAFLSINPLLPSHRLR